MDRISTLYGLAMISTLQDDMSAAARAAEQGRVLVEHIADAEAHAMIRVASGFQALINGDLDRCCGQSERALDVVEDPTLRVGAMILLGWALEFRGELDRALVWQEKALGIAEACGELVYREYALWSLGIGWWRNGRPSRARQLLEEALRLTQMVPDPRQAAASLEGLAWIAGEQEDHHRAAVLLASAETLRRTVGVSTVMLPRLLPFHEECERQARQALGPDDFQRAYEQGAGLSSKDVIAFATADPHFLPH